MFTLKGKQIRYYLTSLDFFTLSTDKLSKICLASNTFFVRQEWYKVRKVS